MTESLSNNGFGRLFPTEDGAAMVAALGIAPGDRVLDVGGGGMPFPAATAIVDYDLYTGLDRDQAAISIDHRWIAADAQALPFGDHSFDFVYCTHVLEHVDDPAKACEELMRVAPRGYLETPRRLTELLHGHPTHRWLIDIVDGVLTFERRCFLESPLENMLLPLLVNQPSAYRSFLVENRNLSCVQLLWEGRFSYRIIEPDGWQDAFDYNNPLHAAKSHYHYALNLLAYGAPVGFVSSHAIHAMNLADPHGNHAALASACALLSGDILLANKLLARAQDYGCHDLSLKINLGLIQQQRLYEAELPDNKGSIRNDAKVDALTQNMLAAAVARIDAMEQSASWRMTRPLRSLRRLINHFIGYVP